MGPYGSGMGPDGSAPVWIHMGPEWVMWSYLFRIVLQATVMMKLTKKNNNKINNDYLNDALMTSIAGISAAIKNTG